MIIPAQAKEFPHFAPSPQQLAKLSFLAPDDLSSKVLLFQPFSLVTRRDGYWLCDRVAWIHEDEKNISGSGDLCLERVILSVDLFGRVCS